MPGSLFAIEDRILSEKGIKEAIAEGKIKIDPSPDEEQFQPSSLDVKVGSARIFDDEVRWRYYEDCKRRETGDPRHDMLIREEGIPDSYGKFVPDERDALLRLTHSSVTDIFFHEKITFNPEEYWMSVDLRSSRGRLGLSPRLEIPVRQEDGRYCLEVRSYNPNPLLLYGHSKFAQVFFHPKKSEGDGYLVNDPREALKIAKKVCEGPFTMDGFFLVLDLGDWIWRCLPGSGEIDTKENTNTYYEQIPTHWPLEITNKDSTIAPLVPSVNLPEDIGIRLFHEKHYHASHNERYFFPYDERFDLNAGWGDPGYHGNLTAHPRTIHYPRILVRGRPVCYAAFYRYKKNRVGKVYGSETTNSHYQHSEGSISRS